MAKWNWPNWAGWPGQVRQEDVQGSDLGLRSSDQGNGSGSNQMHPAEQRNWSLWRVLCWRVARASVREHHNQNPYDIQGPKQHQESCHLHLLAPGNCWDASRCNLCHAQIPANAPWYAKRILHLELDQSQFPREDPSPAFSSLYNGIQPQEQWYRRWRFL